MNAKFLSTEMGILKLDDIGNNRRDLMGTLGNFFIQQVVNICD